ncbi:MAG: hypothetical protein IBX72_11180 [Nitrospirae bacterium]|nr:hypothetical protein [Nitrospirota bacterium]
MKSKYILLFAVYCLLFAVFFWGCGNGPGSPGSEGAEDTGVMIDAIIIPAYPANVDPEDFTDHNATVIINARLINPDTTFQPGNLHIEKYTVEYRRSLDSIGAPPILSDTRHKNILITPPTGTGVATVEDTVILVDLLRKDRYKEDVLSGQYGYGPAYINNYTAIYTFEGQNDFGTRFKFKTQTDFQIGWFDYCN